MRIVDLHTFKGDSLYVGRPMPGRPGSALGNPFKPVAGEPVGSCLGRYRAWLFDHIRNRDAAALAVLAQVTEDAALGCWCATLDGEAVFTAPEVCHAQVIAKAARWVREQRVELPAPAPAAATLRCLSLWQPWASLLVAGEKRVETRGWPIRHRGPLLVHAAQKWNPDLAHLAADPLFFRPALESAGCVFVATKAACRAGWGLPFGAIIGRVDVIDCFPTEIVREGLSAEPAVETGPGWRHLDIDMKERAFGDYGPGRFAFLCENPVRFPEPIPYRGMQGLFEVPADVLTEVPAG